MGKLRDFIRETYEGDPTRAVKFINRTVRLVKIGRHWWRGYRKMTDGTVAVSGRTVAAESATKPSWKLLPKEVGSEFSNFERSIDMVVSSMCVTQSVAGEDDRQPLVFGGGVYAIDVNMWPKANELLKAVQIKWDECANQWCTEDGYEKFHELIKEQVGADEYENVKNLVPKAEVLRGRFWLEVTPLPFRLTENVVSPDEDRGRSVAVAELIEAAVKTPRDEAAAVWRSLAGQLVEADGSNIKAHRPMRKNKDGTMSATSRHVSTPSIINAARAATSLDRAARFHDPAIVQSIASVRRETSEDKTTAAVLVGILNSNDTEAVRVARILLDAADVASDEALMCMGVGKAISVGGL